MKRLRAEQKLILLSARTAEMRSATAGEAVKLAANVDWSEIAVRLRMRRLLGALGPRMIDLLGDKVDGEFEAAVEEALTAGRRQGAFLQLLSLRVIGMLADAGIPAAALKGPALSEAIYGDPGRRISTDIDLLVAPEHLQSAVSVVRELGYATPMDHVEPDGLPLLHFAMPHENGVLPPVELHWRIHWYEQEFARERLLPPEVDREAHWRPEPVDELAALLLFYARDGFIDLRLAADLSGWWDTLGAAVPESALDDLFAEYPKISHVIAVAAQVAERVVGLPVDQLIGEMPKLRHRERVAVRLANPNPHGSQSQLYADRGLIDGLLTPSPGLRGFVRRQLLPPKDVLEQQAGHAHRARTRAPMSRFFGVLARYGLTMTRLLSPRETLR